MRVRFAAVLIAGLFAFPVAGLADEKPWAVIKDMLREPVNDIKRQFKQLRPPAKAKALPQQSTVNRSKPAAAPKQETATVPIPVAKPKPTASSAAEPAVAVTPQQGNSPILVEDFRAVSEAVETDTETTERLPPPDALDTPRDVTTTLMPTDTTTPVADAVLAKTSAGTVETLLEKSDTAESVALPLAPIPRARPEGAMAYVAAEPDSPALQSAAAIGAVVGPLPSLAKPPPAAGSACGAALSRLGVEAEAIAPIHDGACGVPKPVSVAAFGSGATDLTSKAIVNCQVAETLAVWLKDDAQPAAQKFLSGKIVGLRVAASYACRSRNSVAGAKLSEHGRGNAIDISAFKVSGRGWVRVGGARGLAETRFLKALQKSACGPFKTVLGPGSDAYHNDHFHFDLAKRSLRGKSKGLYCR